MWVWVRRIVLGLLALVVLGVSGVAVYALAVGRPPAKRPDLVTALPPGVPEAPRGWPSEYTALAAGLTLYDLIAYENGPPVPGVAQTMDIAFSAPEGHTFTLDLYRAEGAEGPQPGIVLFYGGGWRSGDKDQLRVYAQHFAKHGYTVATPQYRLREAGQWPNSVHDAKAAVRWMRAHAAEHGVDPDRIGVMGNSAGAYLAMMVAYTPGVPEFEGDGGWAEHSSAAQAVVNIYGPTDFTDPLRRDHPLLTGYMNGTYEEDPARFERASPIRYVRSNSPPTCVIHGTVDMLVPVRQGDWLVEALRTMGVPHLYSRIDGWPHAMDVVERVNQHTRALVLAFFDEHLKGR